MSRKVYFRVQVLRALETLTREKELVERLMLAKGEGGGVDAKVREVEQWAAKQEELFGLGRGQFGVAGVYYMALGRLEMRDVDGPAVYGRRRTVVVQKSDNKVPYQVRSPNRAEEKRRFRRR